MNRHNAIVRKVDLRLLPIVCTMYALSYIDRVNIGFAKLYGMNESIHLNSSQYAWTLSIFYIGYSISQIPSNMVLKYLTPRIWFSIILCLWGATTIAQGFSSEFSVLIGLRFMLGITEAG